MQVEQYLQPPAAERLHRCLRDEVPWTLALRDGAGACTIDHAAYAAMDAATYARLVAQTAAGAQAQFGFAYDSHMMVTAYQQRRDPGLLLHGVLNSSTRPSTSPSPVR